MSAAPIPDEPPHEPSLRLVPAERADDGLSTDELGSRIVGLAGRLAAGTCRWLLLVAEFDRREGCARWGLATTAAWLMHTCALSRRTAFEHVRVARSLLEHPDLAQAMAVGRLSYSQVRAITRVVGPGDVATAADLAASAQHCSIGQLETLVRGLRVVDANENGTQAEDDYVRTGWTAGSRWQLTARLVPEQGQLVESVIATVARAEGLTRPEALVRMAELALAAVNDSENAPRPLRGDERAAVVVHVNAADIPPEASQTAGDPAPEPTDEDEADAGLGSPGDECSPEHSAARESGKPAGCIADGPGLRWTVIERLLCNGRIRTAVHDDVGDIKILGRSHRTVPIRLFRALLHRDHGTCRFPGCRSRCALQAHHVRHWLRGGATDLCNLVLLCERHHHLHHEAAFDIQVRPDGQFVFVSADGRDLSRPPDRSDLAATAGDVDEVHSTVGAEAATPRWDGLAMDRDFAVACFAETRARERERWTA